MEKKEDLTNSENDESNSTEEEFVKDEQEIDESPSVLKNQLTEAYSKNESLQSKYLRTFADLENLKKKINPGQRGSNSENSSTVNRGPAPVLDAFKMGLDEAQKADPEGPVVNGFKMAINQMQNTLEDYGLVCIEGIGEPFDPKFHDAIGHELGEDEDMVLQVIRKGYCLRDHLLRPASVIVSKKAVDESVS